MGIKFNSNTGFWEASYSKRHPITRMPFSGRRTRCKTEAEAKRAEKELVLQIEKKLHEKVIPKWGNFIMEYYEHSLSENTKKTATNYLQCIRCYTEEWNDRSIDSITTDDIRRLVKDRVGDKSQAHQRNLVHFIRITFSLAVDKGILSRNPTPQMKFRIGDKIKRSLTKEQVTLLLNRAKEYNWEWYPHVATAVYTGMRNGELYSLTWDKVDLDNRRILVDSSWNKIDGFKSTKTGDDRIIEIAPQLLIVLKELKLQSADSHFVLPRVARWAQGAQAESLRMFLVGLGLPHIRFHDLRATWATLMLGNGVEPAKVMVMGGWKDMKTLMTYFRKSGISIKGITDGLDLHNPSQEEAKVLHFGRSVVNGSSDESGNS